MALAVLVWKAMRQQPYTWKQTARMHPDNLKVGELALDMAKRAGCLQEFMKWLNRLPVMDITVKEIDPWPRSEKSISLGESVKRGMKRAAKSGHRWKYFARKRRKSDEPDGENGPSTPPPK